MINATTARLFAGTGRLLRNAGFGGSALCLSAALALSSMAAPARADDTVTIVIGSTAPHDFILYVAEQAGFFAEEGLKPDIVPVNNGAGQTSAILGGSADIGFLGITQDIRAVSQGGDMVILGRAFDVLSLPIILSEDAKTRQGITDDMPIGEKLARLKGLTIGATGPGSTTDGILRALITSAGMNPDTDITIHSSNAPALFAAFENKAIDGFVFGSPWMEVAQVKGLGGPLFDPFKGEVPELDGVLYKVLSTSRATLAAKPDLLLRSMRALDKAIVYIRENPDKLDELLRPKFPDMDPTAYEMMIARYVGGVPDGLLVTEAQFDRAKEYMAFVEGTEVSVSYGDVVDTALVGQLGK